MCRGAILVWFLFVWCYRVLLLGGVPCLDDVVACDSLAASLLSSSFSLSTLSLALYGHLLGYVGP